MIIIQQSRILVTGINELPENLVKLVTEYNTYTVKSKREDGKFNYIPIPDWQAFKLSANKELGSFFILPRNIPRKIITSYFPDHSIKIDASFDDYSEVNFNCLLDPRDETQVKALDFLHGRNDYVNIRKNQRALVLQTGKGKTFVTIKYLAESKLKALVLVHKESLLQNPWKKDILEKTDIQESEICFLSGKDSIKRAIKNINKYKIFVGIYRTISSIIDSNQELFLEFMNAAKFGIKVYDEAHKEQKAIFNLDSSINIKETLYLTATPERSDFYSNKVYMLMLPSSYQRFGWEEDFISEKYHNVVMITYKTNPSNDWQTSISINKGVSLIDYFNYISTNDDAFNKYYDCIKRIILHYINKKLRIVIVTGLKQIASDICYKLREDFPNEDIGNYTSLIKNKDEKIQQLTKNIIVTTHKSLDAGEDFELDVLINTIPLGSKTPIVQLSGRIRYYPEKPKHPYLFIDLIDIGFQKTKDQQKVRKKILSETRAKTLTSIAF